MYADATRRASTLAQLTRVVATRTTAGPDIVAGTWMCTRMEPEESGHDGRLLPVAYHALPFQWHRPVGRLLRVDRRVRFAERTVEGSGLVLERQTYYGVRSEPISNDPMPGVDGVWTYGYTLKPLLAQTRVTRGTHTWTTTPWYHFGLGNYNDYGRPWHIGEVDEGNPYWKRDTNRTFQDRLHACTSSIASPRKPSASGCLTMKARDRSRAGGRTSQPQGF